MIEHSSKKKKNEKIKRLVKLTGMNPSQMSERCTYHSLKDEFHAGNTEIESEEF